MNKWLNIFLLGDRAQYGELIESLPRLLTIYCTSLLAAVTLRRTARRGTGPGTDAEISWATSVTKTSTTLCSVLHDWLFENSKSPLTWTALDLNSIRHLYLLTSVFFDNQMATLITKVYWRMEEHWVLGYWIFSRGIQTNGLLLQLWIFTINVRDQNALQDWQATWRLAPATSLTSRSVKAWRGSFLC